MRQFCQVDTCYDDRQRQSKVLLACWCPATLCVYCPSINRYSVLQAQAFYMYEDVPDSDEELSVGHGSPSDLSAASSQAGSVGSHASSTDISSAEVASRPSPGDAEDASPAAKLNDDASNTSGNRAADQQPANADSYDEDRLAVSMSPATHMLGVQSCSSYSKSAAGKQLQGDLSPSGSCLVGQSRQEENGTDPEHAGTIAADQGQQLSDPKVLLKPGPATNSGAEMPGAPSASAQAPTRQVSQAGGVSEEPRKRKAATVFDQGIADQAEAVDLDAGIAAGAADDMNVNASMSANGSPKDAGNIADKVSADMSDDAQLSLSTRQTRRTQSRLAPWR